MPVSNILNPFFASEVRCAEDVADASGDQVMLGSTDGDMRHEERRLVRMLLQKQVDGVIAIPRQVWSERVFGELTHAGVQLVLVSRSLPGFDRVTFDFAEQIAQAVDHLVGGGARRIASSRLPRMVRRCARRSARTGES